VPCEFTEMTMLHRLIETGAGVSLLKIATIIGDAKFVHEMGSWGGNTSQCMCDSTGKRRDCNDYHSRGRCSMRENSVANET